MNVLVLLGGTLSERDVSLRSGKAAADALKKIGHHVLTYDPAEGFEGLTDLLRHIEVVFPALHGEGGEDGIIQEYLEQNHIPFVGSGSEASMLCFDKAKYKDFLKHHGFPVPTGELVTKQTFTNHPFTKQPYVLKPRDGGSSIDTFIVHTVSQADINKINKVFDRHTEMLLEELIEGIETTVAIIGDQAMPVIEIIPPEHEEFDYENKYNGKTQELCPPLNVPKHLQQQAQELALKIHKLTNCRDMSRTDIMISKTNQLFVLETNTIPGLTSQSLLPKAAQAAGIDMPELVNMLVKGALTN